MSASIMLLLCLKMSPNVVELQKIIFKEPPFVLLMSEVNFDKFF